MVKSSKKSLGVYMGQPVQAQILKYLPKSAVDDIALLHKSDYYTKNLSTYGHLVSLLFGIMSSCYSLRDLALLLAAEQNKLLHLSIDYKITRSSLGRVNSSRNPKVFESIYFHLLGKSRRFLRDSRQFAGAVEKLFAIDSTTITLSSDILKGTGKPSYLDGRQKGGAKVHAIMNVEEGVPCLVKIGKAAESDSNFMGMICNLAKGSFIAMDRAYCKHDMLEKFSGLMIYYVTRMKDIVKYRVIRELYAEAGSGKGERVLRDEVVSLSLSKKNATHICRRIEYMGVVKDRNGKESEKLFVFITNNLRLPALTVAGIYRNRWQIELLFKRIKQNFQLKYFYGDSANAIKSQIWATLISCLLLTIVHRKASEKRKWAFSSMVSLVRSLLMSYINLDMMLSDPDTFPNAMFGRPPPKEPDLFALAGIKV